MGLTLRQRRGRSCQSQSQTYFTTGGLLSSISSWCQAPWHTRPVFIFQVNTCSYIPYVISSLTRGWVCHLQLLIALTSAVILGSGSRGTHNHILLSQIRDSLNLEGQVPLFISPRNRVAQLYPQALGSLFVASYDLSLICLRFGPYRKHRFQQFHLHAYVV
jgi:hypothetical protein